MSAAVTPKNFLSLLARTGLVEKSVLKESLAELSRQAAGQPVNLERLIQHLIDAGLVTPWHCDKLKTGKYKGFFLGKYKLLGHLGTGGMSTVYLAQHTIFDQQRAIKVLPKNRLASKTYLERFYREGRAAASLNHKNIVRVYDIGNEADTHYLVMEYVEGQDIYEMVKRQGPLDFKTAIDYTIQALTGLKHAHENDLVHRDIKPANLLVTPDGTVKILDLGLALFQEGDSSLTMMHNEKVLGTADYLSPEQAVDSHNIDQRADIYSAGCTLYFMLTGRPPFHEGTIAQRIARHQSVPPERIRNIRPDCPEPLAAIVEKMMAKNPDERYASCDPVMADLRTTDELLTTRNASGDSAPVAAATKTSRPAAASDSPKPVPAAPDPTPARPANATRTASARASSRPATPAARTQPQSRKSKPATAGPNRTAPPSPVTGRGQPRPRDDGRGVSRPPDSRKKSPVSVGRKPHVEAGDVSIAGAAESDVADVRPGDRALTEFVKKNQQLGKVPVRIPRSPLKNQLIMVGMVLGMLILLGAVLVVAMRLSTPAGDNAEKDARATRIDHAGPSRWLSRPDCDGGRGAPLNPICF